MNIIQLPREIQDLVPLADSEIKIRIKQSTHLVDIFHKLKKDQISHFEKPLADRFLHIIEETDIEPSIKHSIIGIFRDLGGIGTDLTESQLDKIIQDYGPGDLVSNWDYFTSNNKKNILFILIKRSKFGDLLDLTKKTDVALNVVSDEGIPLLQYVYVRIIEQKEANPLIFDNRRNLIKAFIQKGADLDAKSKRGETLLEKVIIHGDDLVLKEIIEHGVNPNVVDKEGIPLVYLAYQHVIDRPESSTEEENEQYKRVFNILVSMDNIYLSATDLKEHDLFQLIYGRGDRPTIDLFLKHPSICEEDRNGYLLMMAYQEGNWNAIKALLQKKSINLNVKNSLGITPLHYICSKNLYPKLVKALLMRVRPDVNVKDYAGDTPLFMAFVNGDVDLINTLLILGAKQDVIGSQGDTPLHRVYHMNPDFLFTQLLNKKILNLNVRDSQGKTLLQHVYADKNRKFLKFLLNQQSVNLYFLDENGEHLMDMTNFLPDSEIMKVFLENPNIKKADKNGYNLLMACRKRDWKAALSILEKKEIDPNFKDEVGNSPLLMAYQAKNIDVIEALLKRDELDPNISDSMGNPLIFVAYKNYHTVAMNSRPFYKKIFQGLLQCKNINLNLKNSRGSSLLHFAYSHDDMKFLQELLEDERVDPNLLYKDRTLLATAYENNDGETVDLLLLNPRVNPNVYLENGRPLLIQAFLKKDISLVNRLLEDKRTDPNIKDREDRTILFLALERFNGELAEKLLRNKKVDPNVSTKNHNLVFDAVLIYDFIKNGITIETYYENEPRSMMRFFFQHPKISKADRNGYKLYIAIMADKLEDVKEIFSEAEINLNLEYCFGIAVLKKRVEIVQELLRRRAELKNNHLFQVARINERELSRLFFDAGSDFDPYNSDTGKLILQVLFPNWDWDLILENPTENMEAIFSDPANLESFLVPGAKDVNPLELFLVFPNPKLYAIYLASLTKKECSQYLNGIKRMYPNRTLFLGLETKFSPPEKPKRNLPDIKNFSLEKAVTAFKRHYGDINFSDPKKPDYTPSNMILDQGVRCSASQLREYGESFCLYIMDFTKSKFHQEKKDSQSYQRLREKFRYFMYHVAHECQRLKTDTKLTPDEKICIKRNIDNILMLIASSGNHCMIAKNDVLEEGLDYAYGVAYVPTLTNQVAHIVHRYRLGVIEKIFTDSNISPPQVLIHDMHAFMVRYKDQLGVLIEDLVEDDPFMEGVQLDLSFLKEYEKKNIPKELVNVVLSELQGRNSELNPMNFQKWLTENTPEEWNQFDELLFDLEHMPQDLGYAYLYRNFSISPSPEEILGFLAIPNEATHVKKLKEISFQVNQEYQEIRKNKELEIHRIKKTLETMEGSQKEEMQEELNKLVLEIPTLSGKKLEEQKKRKIAYLKEQGIYLSPKDYLLMLKSEQDIPVIKKEMREKPVEKQWQILERYNIDRISPLEALQNSGKENDEVRVITIEMNDKTEEEQWETLAQHKISNPNPKTPLEALEKYRSQQYANQAYVDGWIRSDRIISFLIFVKQLQIAS